MSVSEFKLDLEYSYTLILVKKITLIITVATFTGVTYSSTVVVDNTVNTANFFTTMTTITTIATVLNFTPGVNTVFTFNTFTLNCYYFTYLTVT